LVTQICEQRKRTMRGILLWLIGIQIPIIILLWLFGVLH
jgi:hypothetical protein